jgi:poly(A) polymerase
MATGILLLALAEHLAADGPTLQLGLWQQQQSCIGQALAQRYDYPSETVDPPRLLDGNDIIQALNLEPGPIIGELLEEIREAQVAGDVRTVEQALSWARQVLGRKDR